MGSNYQVRLTKEQLAEYQEAFDQFDDNHNGRLDLRKLRKIMTQLGQEISDKELRQIMDSVDREKLGYIDFERFCYIMYTCAPRSLDEQLRETFSVFDQDHKGKITSSNLKRVLSSSGDSDITDDDIDDLIREIDLDGDGEIDFEEFVKVMVSGK